MQRSVESIRHCAEGRLPGNTSVLDSGSFSARVELKPVGPEVDLSFEGGLEAWDGLDGTCGGRLLSRPVRPCPLVGRSITHKVGQVGTAVYDAFEDRFVS